MNYADNFDRLKGDYSFDRKSVKRYMRLVFHFVDYAIKNAFIIHEKLPNVEHFKNKNVKRNIYNTLLSDHLNPFIAFPSVAALTYASLNN